MAAQIFLVAPRNAEASSFPDLLGRVLAAAPVAALLLPNGAASPQAYARLVRSVVPVAQANDCAVLIDGLPDDVKKLGADGVHMQGGTDAIRDAVEHLRPECIVGAGDVHSRHDAMVRGEAEVDYVFFGSIDGSPDPEARGLAEWWAETFEIPAVLAPGAADIPDLGETNIEFIALGDTVWTAKDGPDVAIAEIARQLGVS